MSKGKGGRVVSAYRDSAPRPTRARIGPFMWTLAYEKLPAHLNATGITDLSTLTITVDPEQPEDLIRETLLHEVLHACHLVLGVVNAEADITSEQFISLVSPTLFAALRANSLLAAYLTQED